MSGDAVTHKPGFRDRGLTLMRTGNSAEQNQKEIWPQDPGLDLAAQAGPDGGAEPKAALCEELPGICVGSSSPISQGLGPPTALSRLLFVEVSHSSVAPKYGWLQNKRCSLMPELEG